MKKKISSRLLSALLLSGVSCNVIANTSFSSPPPSLSSVNAQGISTNVKKLVISVEKSTISTLQLTKWTHVLIATLTH